MSSSNIQSELALHAAIRRHITPIVQAANRDAALLEGSRMEKSQLQNVLNVAEESRNLAVVANFIRYQIGRARIGDIWRHNDFGESVVQQILDPDGIIERQARKVLSESADTLLETFSDQLRFEFLRYYLGYLQRAFVYGNSGVKDAWKHLKES